SPLGVKYEAYQLDLHAEDFPTRVDRMFASIEASMDDRHIAMPVEVAVKYVKQALKHYARLPLQPDLVRALLPLVGKQQHVETDLELSAVQLQTRIRNVLQSF